MYRSRSSSIVAHPLKCLKHDYRVSSDDNHPKSLLLTICFLFYRIIQHDVQEDLLLLVFLSNVWSQLTSYPLNTPRTFLLPFNCTNNLFSMYCTGQSHAHLIADQHTFFNSGCAWGILTIYRKSTFQSTIVRYMRRHSISEAREMRFSDTNDQHQLTSPNNLSCLQVTVDLQNLKPKIKRRILHFSPHLTLHLQERCSQHVAKPRRLP